MAPRKEALVVSDLVNKLQNHKASMDDGQMPREQTLRDTAEWPPAPAGAALPSMDDGVNGSSVTNPHNVTIKGG
ncbi:MAG: hypothetical protein AAFR24_16465 [Cyanobacteria bacterium J06627_3]